MTTLPTPTLTPIRHVLSTEEEVFKCLFEFNAPRFGIDADGDVINEAWVSGVLTMHNFPWNPVWSVTASV